MSMVLSSPLAMGISVTSGSTGIVFGTRTVSTPFSKRAVMPVSSAFSGSYGPFGDSGCQGLLLGSGWLQNDAYQLRSASSSS